MISLNRLRLGGVKKLLIGLAIISVLFRPSFKAIFGSLGELSAITPVVVMLFLLPKVRLAPIKIIFFVFPIYLFLSYALHVTFIYSGDFYSASIGLYVILVPYLFWLIVSQSGCGLDIRKYDLLFIHIGVLNAVGGIIFFFYDPLIFGLIGESIYSNTENMAKGHIDLRAKTFIGSPQTVGVYSALMFFFTYTSNLITPKSKFIFLILFLLLGVLSGSKSFYLSLGTTVIIFSLCTKIRYRYFLILLLAPVALFFLKDAGRIFDRIVGIFKYLEIGISQHATYQAWFKVLAYDSDIWNIFFGNGIGALSRAAMESHSLKFPFSAAEGFLLQIFFEIGLIGLIFFLLSISFFIILQIKKSDFSSFALTMGVLINMMVSPSFYGFGFSFFAYYILFRPLCK